MHDLLTPFNFAALLAARKGVDVGEVLKIVGILAVILVVVVLFVTILFPSLGEQFSRIFKSILSIPIPPLTVRTG